MESVKVCRFCLAMGVKMHLIQEKDVKTLLGPNVAILQNLPQYGCYECTALIDKFNKFIDKCATTRAILCNILEENDEITKYKISSIDRRSIKLESNLKFSRTFYVNCGISAKTNQKQHSGRHQNDKQSGLRMRDKIAVINTKSKDLLDKKTIATGTQKRDILKHLLIDLELNDVETNKDSCSEDDRQNKKRPGEADPIEKVEIQEVNIENVRIKEEIDCIHEVKVEDNCEVDSLKSDENSSLSEKSDIDEGKDISLKKIEIDDLSDLLASSSDDDLLLNVKKKVQKKKPEQKQKTDDSKAQKRKNTNDMDLIMRLIRPNRKKKREKRERKLTELQTVLLENFVITQFSMAEQISEFAKRKESSNYKNSVYKCELCYRGFQAKPAYDNHVITHDSSSGQMVCPICKIVIKNRSKTSRHMLRHRMRFACKTCSFITDNRTSALLHKKWHEGVTYQCRLCGDISHKKTSYLSHMRIKHPSEFICNLCGYSFLSLKGVQMHKDKSHRTHKQMALENKDGPSGETGRYCEECDVRFATRDAWRRHLVTSARHNHTTSRSLRCRECGDNFETVDALSVHRTQSAACSVPRPPHSARAAPSPDHYPTQCEHCDMVVTSRSCHWHHYQSFHRDQRYPHAAHRFICDACGKGFKAKCILNEHVRAKHGENKSLYECDYCQKQFHTKRALYIHIQRHLNTTHLCTLCGKTVRSKSSLVEHYRGQHGGPRPFPCQYCGKTFTRGSIRTVHINEVHLGLAKKRIRKPRRKCEPDN